MTEGTNLNKFLLSAKLNTKDVESHGSVTVVLGNESCDLDSAVSSIVYAYFLYVTLTANDNNKVVIPVLNVNRRNYDIKTEVKYYLNFNGITADHLVFKDEIDLVNLKKAGKLKLVLVDHHVLQDDLRELNGTITRILDHRPLDDRASWSKDVSVDLQLVGSCTTLVGKALKQEDLLKDGQLAMLIYGTIILDTSNFSKASNKATDLDLEIAAACKKYGEIEQSKSTIYAKLIEAKRDISSLSAYSLLNKDLKTVSGIPIPVLTVSVKDFLERPDAEESIKRLCSESNAPVLLILGIIISDDNKLRCIYIYPNASQGLADHIEASLKASVDPKLDLHSVECKHKGKLFREINSYTTRKRLLPIIIRAYEEFSSKSH